MTESASFSSYDSELYSAASSASAPQPNTVRLHPVFHVSLLEHAASDPFPGQVSPPPPAVLVDGEEEWEVESVLDSRTHYRRLQYLVKWKGYDMPTWQPASDLEHATDIVREFQIGRASCRERL